MDTVLGILKSEGMLNAIMGAILLLIGMWMRRSKTVTAVYGFIADKRPLIVEAIKWAESQIPDNTENSAVAKLDSALKRLVDLDRKLNGGGTIPESWWGVARQAITAVHGELEARGKLPLAAQPPLVYSSAKADGPELGSN